MVLYFVLSRSATSRFEPDSHATAVTALVFCAWSHTHSGLEPEILGKPHACDVRGVNAHWPGDSVKIG
jgi:hypothetical protein